MKHFFTKQLIVALIFDVTSIACFSFGFFSFYSSQILNGILSIIIGLALYVIGATLIIKMHKNQIEDQESLDDSTYDYDENN